MSSEPAPTLYELLGVEPTATQDEIRAAYRRKARELHPDRNRDDPEANAKFQQMSEAYNVLKDPTTREHYDKYGLHGETPETPEEVNELEIFSQIIGLGRSRGIPTGNKVSPTVRFIFIDASLAYSGGISQQKVKLNVICQHCNGTGSNDGVEYPICPDCNGAGSLSPIGGLQFLFPCHNCHNVGYMTPPEKICKFCKGRKVVSEKRMFDVQIELGIADEECITLKNQGDEFPGKEPADIQFMPMIRFPNGMFRDGDDLYFVKQLSKIELQEGTSFSIEHPSGRTLNVYTPRGQPINTSRIKRLEGEGMPCRGNVQFKGDLYVIMKESNAGFIKQAFMKAQLFFARKKEEILLEDAPEEIQESFIRRLQEIEARAEECQIDEEPEE